MMADKIYCGSGKEKKFDNGGSLISVTMSLDDLIKQYNEHGYVSGNGTRTIKIDVSTRKTTGQYGETHSVTLNTWHPSTFMKPARISISDGSAKQAPSVTEEDEMVF